jgi:molybdate transport repressor ModE-like protein
MPRKSRTPSLNKPAAAKRRAKTQTLRPQLRISFKKSIAMGPGKADLLDAIAQSGSISAAARALGMSYRRAWLLVETMNECFKAPLVETATGGRSGHGFGAGSRPALSRDGKKGVRQRVARDDGLRCAAGR